MHHRGQGLRPSQESQLPVAADSVWLYKLPDHTMTNYERRLARDKAAIRERVALVGQRVNEAVAAAVAGLLSQDYKACSLLILGDMPINREIRAIDRLCHAFVARHLPSAGHLRFVSSVLQMDVGLERIGDYAATIAREALHFDQPPPDAIAQFIRELGGHACETLQRAMEAFAARDTELAKATNKHKREASAVHDRAMKELLKALPELSPNDALALQTVLGRLKRVANQAENIAEETLFEITGELKEPTTFRVLFVDDDCSLHAPLAAALGRKAFPKSGAFRVGCVNQDAPHSPALLAIADELSLDVTTNPISKPTDSETLSNFNVVVSLSETADQALKDIPYSTVLLKWKPPPPPEAAQAGADYARDLSRFLAEEIRELMVLARGEDAD